jgi:hypothetical protein
VELFKGWHKTLPEYSDGDVRINVTEYQAVKAYRGSAGKTPHIIYFRTEWK